jgi:hypothetical protein
MYEISYRYWDAEQCRYIYAKAVVRASDGYAAIAYLLQDSPDIKRQDITAVTNKMIVYL